MSDWNELREAVDDGIESTSARWKAEALIDKLEARGKSAEEALRGLLAHGVDRCDACGAPATKCFDWELEVHCDSCAAIGEADLPQAAAVRAALAWLSGAE